VPQQELTIEDIRSRPKLQQTPDDFKIGKINIGNPVDKIKDGATAAFNKVKGELEDVKRELEDAKGTINKVGDFIKNFPNLIKNEFEKILDKVKGVVNDALKDIKAGFAWVNKVKEFFGKVKEFFVKFKGWIITVAIVVCVLCMIPILTPLFQLLMTIRSAGSSVANSVAPVNSVGVGVGANSMNSMAAGRMSY
jgi:hypothetical protein